MTVCNETSQSLTVTKSLDDEYTPGVFKVSSDVSQLMAVTWDHIFCFFFGLPSLWNYNSTPKIKIFLLLKMTELSVATKGMFRHVLTVCVPRGQLVSLSSPGGFLQWRPVAYTDPESTIEHSTSAREYGVQPAPGPPASPLLAAWFGPSVPGRQLNVTFGLSEDGWYKDTRYAAW